MSRLLNNRKLTLYCMPTSLRQVVDSFEECVELVEGRAEKILITKASLPGRESEVSFRGTGMLATELQTSLLQEDLLDRGKKISKHKKSKVALWLNQRQRPAWVHTAPEVDTMRLHEFSLPSGQGQGAGAGEEGMEMCSKLCENGQVDDAVDALNLLVQRGIPVHNNLLYRLLKKCTANKDLVWGRRIHALCVRCGYDGDAFLATHLMGLYAANGRLEEAMQVFTRVSTPSAYNWSSIILACCKHGEAAEAVRLYRQMLGSSVKPDNHVYAAVLMACAALGDLVTGKEIHDHILATPARSHTFVLTGLFDMYLKCKSLQDAREIFDRLPERSVVTWNAMLAAYAQQGMGEVVLNLHSRMQQEGVSPTSVTFVCLLQACTSVGLGALQQGRQIHAQIERLGLQDDLVLGGCLVTMYATCGSIVDARRLFDRVAEKSAVTWTAMIAGYTRHGMGQEALCLYSRMQHEGLSFPDSITFACLLQACASVGVEALPEGRKLHEQIEGRDMQDDAVLGGWLVNMYALCGSLEDARTLFERLAERNVVAWNGMIAGCSQQGLGQEALYLYTRMQQDGVSPDSFTFVWLLQACGKVGAGALGQGKRIHAQIAAQGLQHCVALGGSLVNMYAKCGSAKDARRVFDRLSEKSMETWTAMMVGYVQQEMGEEALSLYRYMQQERLFPPDSIQYVSLLQACGIGAGLALGRELHAEIVARRVPVDAVVGVALVHMYAKCGSMLESQQAFDSLPDKSVEAWNALMGGYSRQGNSELVFDLLDRMRVEGVEANSVTFLSVLTVCSHVGLVDKGRRYWKLMSAHFGISPSLEHQTCMIDLLGRAGHLDEALEMAKAMPCAPNNSVWHALLGACLKWNNVEVGRQALELAIESDATDAASYVLMSNIFARAELWEEAKDMQVRKVKCWAWKKPGQSSCIDVGGVVHTFAVGHRMQDGNAYVGHTRLAQTVQPVNKEVYVPHLDLALRGIAS